MHAFFIGGIPEGKKHLQDIHPQNDATQYPADLRMKTPKIANHREFYEAREYVRVQ